MKRKRDNSETPSKLPKGATAFSPRNDGIHYLIPNGFVDTYVTKVSSKIRNDIKCGTLALVVGIWIGSELVVKDLIFLDQDETFPQELCKCINTMLSSLCLYDLLINILNQL